MFLDLESLPISRLPQIVIIRIRVCASNSVVVCSQSPNFAAVLCSDQQDAVSWRATRHILVLPSTVLIEHEAVVNHDKLIAIPTVH
jgi:hypothetical protein